MIRTWPVQRAIYTVLSSDATLNAMVTGISDEPLQNQQHPYIVLGEDTAASDDLLSETGSQVTLTMHVWDKDAPTSRAKQIVDRINFLLHNATLTLLSGAAVSCRSEFTQTTRDGDTVHSVVRVRVLTFG